MAVQGDVTQTEGFDSSASVANALTALVDDKAWEHLGLTGEEFRLRWHDGVYEFDLRDEVRALDRLMRSGRWEPQR